MRDEKKILAIETSTEAFSVALQIGLEVNEFFQIAPQQHAMLLLPTIKNLLAEAGIKLHQVDLLAFGCGPGSFTSIRLAASIIQGLAFGADIQVAAVSTLHALAQGAYNELGATTVLSALDARMHEMYLGIYQLGSQGFMLPLCDDMLIKPNSTELINILQLKNCLDYNYSCAGNAWDIYKNEVWNEFCEQKFIRSNFIYPRARDIANLAYLTYACENRNSVLKIGSWEDALPVYLRDKVTS